MGTGSNNPPLPGQGIVPSQEPYNSKPPFDRAAIGGEVQTPIETPRPQRDFRPPEPVPGGAHRPGPVQGAAPVYPIRNDSQRRPITTAPDGSQIVKGDKENARQQAIEARMAKMNEQFENSGGPVRNRTQLQRDFDNAHYNRERG